MAKNIIASCSGWLKLDPVEDVWTNGMVPNVCGPVKIAIFKRELGETAKDKASVEYEPVYSDKDDRFIQDYRFDVSKLEPSAAKEKKGEISTYIIQAIHEAWMDIDIASKSQDQVKRLTPRYLGKLAVINLPILVVLLACAALEKLTLTIIKLRYPPPSETEFSGQDGPQSIHLT